MLPKCSVAVLPECSVAVHINVPSPARCLVWPSPVQIGQVLHSSHPYAQGSYKKGLLASCCLERRNGLGVCDDHPRPWPEKTFHTTSAALAGKKQSMGKFHMQIFHTTSAAPSRKVIFSYYLRSPGRKKTFILPPQPLAGK